MSYNYQPGEKLKRRWFPLWILDRYILKEFLIKFFIIMLLASILFVTGDVFDDLEDFISDESIATVADIILYFLLKLPGNLCFVLPISVLLGCMWTMATFGKNHEITAMRAAGLSLFRCGGAIIAAGLVVTGINYYWNETFVPKAQRKAMYMQSHLTKGTNVPPDQRFLIYNSQDMRRLWLFEMMDDSTVFNSVNLKFREPDSTGKMIVVEEWSARKVVYDENEGWTFFDGYRRKNSRKATGISRPPEAFEQLRVPDATETPGDILDSLKDLEELPIWTIWSWLTKTKNMPENVRQSLMTVLFYRLSFPLSCLMAAFLGVPLATSNERSGIMMAIITAVAIIIAYVVVSQVFMVLGRCGAINAFIAGAAPTIVFISYGMWRVFRQRI